MTPEGAVKAKVRALLRKYHIHYLHIPGSQFGKGGAPDYVACVAGRYIEIECKAGKGTQTELQKVNEKSCIDAGGKYLLVEEGDLNMLEIFIVDSLTPHV